MLALLASINRRLLAQHLAGAPVRRCLAEAVRFELTNGCPLPVFKTGAIDHSATLPAVQRQVFDCKLPGWLWPTWRVAGGRQEVGL